MNTRYSFEASVWLYPGETPWHFVSVPKKEAEAIAKIHAGKPRRGFGAVRVKATVGKTTWETSMFPDKRSGTYIFPLKAQVRKKEGIGAGDTISVRIEL